MASTLCRREAQLRALPAPDTLEFNLPEGHVCLITDDGTPAAFQLAKALMARGWPVAVWRLPAGAQARPAHLPGVTLVDLSEAHLEQSLAEVARRFGPVGAFIHLHPAGDDRLFSPDEKALVKHVFLMAKHLKRPLNDTAPHGHSAFLTVTRLDGQLGLGPADKFSAVGSGAASGGLFGLTKTLALEWPEVFCRAVDLSPDFNAERSVNAILAELHDPNRLITETGWSEQGRVTLVA